MMPRNLAAGSSVRAKLGSALLLSVACAALLGRGGSASSAPPPAPDVNPPVGTIVAWPGQKNTVPPDWMVCDGRELDITQYPQLIKVIGTVWGGTATTKFKLPNLRGRFLRGVDGGAGLDPMDKRVALGAAQADDVGSVQPEDFKSHSHGITDPGHEHRVLWHNFITAQEGSYERSNTAGGDPKPRTTRETTGITINESGGQETRPDNAYVYWIIRVR